MFVGGDDQVMGMGYRISSKETDMHKLRLIPKPDDCSDYLRIETGKFFRLLLTKKNKLFLNGQNKKYMLGKDVEVNAYTDKFFEIKNLFPMAAGEKIVDVAGGKHFLVVVTDLGNVFASGYMLYRALSAIR
jgi:alpha-tubulin suppressor-like RCC1 family protein